MSYLNKELQNRLAQLSDLNRDLLKSFLMEIGDTNMDSEKQDAVTRLRSRIREYVSRGENK